LRIVDSYILTGHAVGVREAIMDRQTASELLTPHLDAIRDAIAGGWSDWHQWLQRNPTPTAPSSRTRANVVYDFVTARLEQYFAEVDGVQTNRRSQYLQVAFAGHRLVLRFKKFRDRKLRTSGIPTEQRRAVEAQEATFDGMAVTYVVAGYLPDEAGVELDLMALACSFYTETLWSIDLEPATLPLAEPIRTAPLLPRACAAPGRQRRPQKSRSSSMNPQMLTLLRESRGMSGAQLAKASGVPSRPSARWRTTSVLWTPSASGPSQTPSTTRSRHSSGPTPCMDSAAPHFTTASSSPYP
jgi:hypothetical protein